MLAVLASVLGVLASAVAVIQGPKAFADLHELGCSMSPTWQNLASRFGDCAAYAAKGMPASSAGDPRALAIRQIKAAGFEPDAAGFIRAVVRNDPIRQHFDTMRIGGDAPTLWRAILDNPVGSNEYEHLQRYLISAPSDHYAGKAREEIRATLKRFGDEAKPSLYRLVCMTKGGTSSEQFLRANLAPACRDEKLWFESMLRFTKGTGELVDMETNMWWASNLRTQFGEGSSR